MVQNRKGRSRLRTVPSHSVAGRGLRSRRRDPENEALCLSRPEAKHRHGHNERARPPAAMGLSIWLPRPSRLIFRWRKLRSRAVFLFVTIADLAVARHIGSFCGAENSF